MIRVTYHPEEFRVEIRGHAGSGPCGSDLVCAAVSALALTLEANVSLLEQRGWVSSPAVRLQQGFGEIRCCPAENCREQVALVLESLCLGFARLAEQWPRYVSYRVGNHRSPLL